MAQNERTLKQSLDSGAILPVYVIVGDDSFLKKQAKDRIIKAAIGEDDGFNLVTFEDGCDLQMLYDELNSCPFTSDRKCVVLSDYNVESCSKTEFERLLLLVGTKYTSSVFIVYFDVIPYDPKKSSKIKELVKTAENIGGAAITANHRTKEDLVRQLVATVKKQDCEMTPFVAGYLIDSCSTDISTLLNEITKLCLYAKQGEITKEMVDLVSVKSVEASIFNLSKRIIAGDTAGAMTLLDDLFFMRIAPEIIVYNISTAFVDMYRALAAKKQGLHPVSIAEDFKMQNVTFRLKAAAEHLRKYDDNKIKLSLDAITHADKEIKSYSSDARLAIEKLIVKLIYIMKTGETLD